MAVTPDRCHGSPVRRWHVDDIEAAL